MSETVLIVGTGGGLSASVARRFAREGAQIVLASRNVEKLAPLAAETKARTIRCDVAEQASIDAMFAACDAGPGAPDVVVYNPSFRVRGPFLDLDPEAVKQTIDISAFGGFLVAQQALKRMVAKGRGVLLFTGASASVKGYAQSAPFAMGKFALRGLAQSLAREFQPKNIHIAHFVIDGGIRAPGRNAPVDQPDALLEPDAIAESYFQIARQPRSAWSWEIELRPWVERF
jgi:NAD(P)-dependent dehydrogenase (short-subunit alcohol dehydrogenase family)